MELTQDEVLKIGKALYDKKAYKNCNECGHNGQTLDVINLITIEKDEIRLTGTTQKTLPVFMSTCPNCGAIKFFNLDVLLGEGVKKEEEVK